MSQNGLLITFYMALLMVSLSSCSKTVEDAQDQDEFVQQSMNEPVQADDGSIMKSFDLNQDLKPDIFKYYNKAQDPATGENTLRLLRKELDLNYDGKIDAWMYYNAKGAIETERYDLDFDGKVDRTDHFGKGVLIKQELDIMGDSKPDVTKYYLKGQVARKEKDRNSDGRTDYWEYFDNGRIERICEADPNDPEGVYCRQADQPPVAARREQKPEEPPKEESKPTTEEPPAEDEAGEAESANEGE